MTRLSLLTSKKRTTDWLLLLIMIISILPYTSTQADEFRPVLLDIKERETGWFDITWKLPVRGNKVLALDYHLPQQLKLLGSPKVQLLPDAQITRASYKNTQDSLIGKKITIEGFKSMQTNVLLHFTLKDDTQYSAVLSSNQPDFIVPSQASKFEVVSSYTMMGTIHILEGIDHLLFVLALLLLISGITPLIKAVTAFTIAHSITLALSTLGLLSLPSAPTEAIIALSIVFLATEIIKNKDAASSSITIQYPWAIAFVFGLFHGLGFAGALAEIGVPQHEVPLALLTFNIGVELGQLIFIAAVLLVFSAFKTIIKKLPQQSRQILPYAIGSIATFWTIERVVSFLPVMV